MQPVTGQPLDLGPAAQPPLGADLAGDPGDLAGEQRQLVDHAVDAVAQAAQIAAELAVAVVQIDPLGQIAVGHRVQHPGGLGERDHQRFEHGVGRLDVRRPGPLAGARGDPLVQPPLPDDLAADALQLGGEMGVAGDDLVEDAGHVGQHPVRGAAGRRALHTRGEIPVAHRVHRREQRPQLTRAYPLAVGRGRGRHGPDVPGGLGLLGRRLGRFGGLGGLRGLGRLGPGGVERHGTPSPSDRSGEIPSGRVIHLGRYDIV
ncbi:hypothetical protein TPA0598_02_03330 [Streptomyces lydicamycinicus]|uniref:Uncharacterized protein n=1 Tax=Streptomyces lydicamycinicus TaxID=1546107 RepID=A0A0P4R2W1_9ACTN|nr:hypothetical protein TPA0598_02_03330 [Streptomyces lydicamycinicus]